jgi:peptide/nickel transport system permease protein
VIPAFTIYLAVLTMLINLGADLLYRVFDPRIQLR